MSRAILDALWARQSIEIKRSWEMEWLRVLRIERDVSLLENNFVRESSLEWLRVLRIERDESLLEINFVRESGLEWLRVLRIERDESLPENNFVRESGLEWLRVLRIERDNPFWKSISSESRAWNGRECCESSETIPSRKQFCPRVGPGMAESAANRARQSLLENNFVRESRDLRRALTKVQL